MDTTIEGYLVKLGFQTDAAGFSKFQGTFREAQRIVEANVGGTTKSLLAMQATIVGTFAAVGGAVLGLADQVAQADLGFQLIGMRMFLATDQAKSLKIATDALGYSLGEIAWNPELRERFDQLVQDQNKLQEGLGPDFEDQMRKIRDIRFEFTRMEVVAQYLGMSVVSNLLKAFGSGPDDILAKLRRLNDWAIQNLPALSNKIVAWFGPIWKDVVSVLGDAKDAAENFGTAFANVIGALSGDSTLEGTAFSFEKLGGAIQAVALWMSNFANAVSDSISLISHLISAIALYQQGNRAGAADELKQAAGEFRTGTGVIGGAEPARAIGSVVPGIGTFVGGVIGGVVGGGLGYQAEERREFALSKGDIQNYIAQTAAGAGVDPRLALAVAQVESGDRQFDSHGNVLRPDDPNSHAMGIFQLQPSTARQMGVDPKDKFQNIVGGVAYLSELLKSQAAMNDQRLNVTTAAAMRLPMRPMQIARDANREWDHDWNADDRDAERESGRHPPQRVRWPYRCAAAASAAEHGRVR